MKKMLGTKKPEAVYEFPEGDLEKIERLLKSEGDGKPEKDTEEVEQQPVIKSVEFDIKDPRNFIQLGIKGLYGNNVLISKFELPGYNHLNYEDTHIKLLRNKLYMPNPRIFMYFFNKIMQAQNDKAPLFNAENSKISEEDVMNIYLHLTKNHIAIYDPEKLGAWTWLNGKFSESDHGWGLETVIGLGNNKLLTKSENLEPCISNDCYVDFTNLNNQGLPNENAKSKIEKYNQGENVYYFYPRDGSVAGFGASSGRANLYCNWGPRGSSSGLGVFGCAEGA